MSQSTPDENPLERQAQPRQTGLTQAEAYGGPESYGSRSEPVDGAASRPGALNMRPLALAGGAMLGATFVLSLIGLSGWVSFAVGVGVFFGLLAYLRPGASPVRRRRVVRAEGVDAAAAQEALDAAEAELAEIDRLAHGLIDRGLRAPLAEMTTAARAVLEHIASDPGDLRRARKYVRVYIPSASAAVRKFAGFGVIDAELSARFRSLVEEMTATSQRQLETLRLDEKTSLEVEMDVLAERLTAERPAGDPAERA